jgi:hypothetical protein
MRNQVILVFLLLNSMNMCAQSSNATVAGEYYLRSVMETASGFQINADSSFQFFFSQGALDRVGKGKWSIHGDSIVFNSAPRPPKDFALLTAKAAPENLITVKITDRNRMILSYVDVTISGGGKTFTRKTDSDGMVAFPLQSINSISLLFRLCPDRQTVFSIDHSSYNYFEFRFEPWVAEVFFEQFSLQLNGKELYGGHPLLNGDKFRYEKN